VVGTSYIKKGKWSHTIYRLELAPGVRAIRGRDGWETGSFREGRRAATGLPTDRWHECANALGVTLEEAQRFLREWRPKGADHYDQVEAALESVASESGEDDFEEIAISFGFPTRSQRYAGFWEWPIIIKREKEEIGRIEPEDNHSYKVVSGPIRILDFTRFSGHGGGYVSIRIAAPAGSRAIHLEEEKDD